MMNNITIFVSNYQVTVNIIIANYLVLDSNTNINV